MRLTVFRPSKKKMWRFSPPQSRNRFSKRSGLKRNRRASLERPRRAAKSHGSGSHLLVKAETQVFMRVYRGIEDSDFIVQMRAGAASALSNVAHRITPPDQLPHAYCKA